MYFKILILGYEPKACILPIRVFKLFGVEKIAITNAAGSVNENVSSCVSSKHVPIDQYQPLSK